ncbi:putative RNA helicase [Heterostelium album PN500]|uniref:ATP-dependent RNA helicase n=1 Tax=Heterostelium pallidum (strain ATCC 26659 / Pp 5 / PN500) TaxID=670386 RepID=D3B3Z5_HETP5|nr:putative RNA helicase [Heterostelium album PN500]EFA84043.1 putative RNA helicase [Heterostelium album PN500]|eukprot:XP_020436160.1 putative RNA helicase [Heterostelium album PN500]
MDKRLINFWVIGYYVQDLLLSLDSIMVSRIEMMDSQSLESIGLPDWIIKNLNDQGIVELLAVQNEIVPFIARTEGHDICVCAPTGSGKTLAYVLPIVQKLYNRVVRRLRVICIVPTHDLVTQTEATFKSITKGTDLVVETLGLRSFALEQSLIVSSHFNDENNSVTYQSLVDIIVCTPGRLVEHLNETPGFDLQHLTYLVIDEADRLLRESFQYWLEKVMDSSSVSKERLISIGSRGDISISDSKYNNTSSGGSSNFRSHIDHLSFKESRVIKLLLSATMSYNPEKISLLKLNAPLYFQSNKISELKYTIPDTLKESYIACHSDQKPLALISVIGNIFKSKQQQQTDQNDNIARIICFTNSIDITQRLNTLLGFIGEVDGVKLKPAQYSSSINSIERSNLLKLFANGDINVLICSDILARGMDLPNVDAVINYNAPPSAVLYVHRVGRTARAGRKGSAYTIVAREEKSYFTNMIKKAGRTQKMDKLTWKKEQYQKYTKSYKNALSQTRTIYAKRKANQKLFKSINNLSQSSALTTEDNQSIIVQDLTEINKKRLLINFE